jgi:tRNA (Thr-GGU) A37 N-methylase
MMKGAGGASASLCPAIYAGVDLMRSTYVLVLRVNPRGDPAQPARGVFSTRSPDRPNPIGLHPVEVLEVPEPAQVRPPEALDGTPIIDIKPVVTSPISASPPP